MSIKRYLFLGIILCLMLSLFAPAAVKAETTENATEVETVAEDTAETTTEEAEVEGAESDTEELAEGQEAASEETVSDETSTDNAEDTTADTTKKTTTKKKSVIIKSIRKNKYTKSYVTVYKKASTKSKKVGEIEFGKKVYVYGKVKNGFYQIKYKGKKRYAKLNKFVSKSPLRKAVKKQSTAYAHGKYTADGSRVKAEFTLAGKKSWLGRGCYLFTSKSNGKIGRCLGYYEFHDTGYGINGDIQRGETIDIYMSSNAQCIQWGRRSVYVVFV